MSVKKSQNDKSGDLKEDIESAGGELKQHVAWDLLSNDLFSPESPTNCLALQYYSHSQPARYETSLNP